MIKIKNLKIKHLGFILFANLTIILAFSRGLFDLSGKQIYGYLAQYGSLGLLSCVMWLQSYRKYFYFSLQSILMIVSAYLFLVIMFVSWILTIIAKKFSEGWLYIGVMVFWTNFFLFTVLYRNIPAARLPWPYMFAIAGVIMSTIGLLQQFGILPFLPGTKEYMTIPRPSALFGSMQHYAIALSIVGMYLMEYFLRTRKKIFLLSSFVLIIAVLISLTRSGYVILLGAILLWPACVFSISKKKITNKIRSKIVYVYAILGISFVIVSFANPVFLERLLSMFDPEGAGNPGRIESWNYGLSVWMDGPIIVGNAVGLVTQSTKKLFPDSLARHAESGVIQQLANFGLLGTVFFYMMFFVIVLRIHPTLCLLRATVIAAAIQSFFYMSIETFPFMFLVGIAPILSDNIISYEKSHR